MESAQEALTEVARARVSEQTKAQIRAEARARGATEGHVIRLAIARLLGSGEQK